VCQDELVESFSLSRTCSAEQQPLEIDTLPKKGANLQPMYHPGIEVTSSILQRKFPPFSAKSVHSSVNLPAGQISDFEVMVRPATGLQALGAAMAQQLAIADPSP